MANKSKLIIILVCILTVSCWQRNWYDSVAYKNESGHMLVVQLYDYPAPYTIIDSLVILRGDSHVWFEPLGEGAVGWTVRAYDSIRFVFDNESYVSYLNRYYISDSIYETVRNPTNPAFMDSDCTRKVGCDYVYFITAEDYENAQPLKTE